VCETVCDQFTNAYRDNTDGYSWCQEVCDPCEAQSYSVEVDGIAVSLSDFIYPAFFNPYATLPQNAPYNHLATIQQPFSLLSGGYAIVRTGGPGTEQQIFAKESTMPDWKRKQKSSEFARMNRRRKT
jgi:hypothetical protein